MIDRLRSLIYPTALVVMLATLWVHAWKQSLDAQLKPGWFPAKDPALIERALRADNSAVELAEAY
jgi:hypothetical protein